MIFHSCRWCNDRGCLACDAIRAENHAKEQVAQEGLWFIQREVEAGRMPPESAAALKGDWFYLLGAAIAHGRHQERARGEAPPGNLEGVGRFEFVEIEE